MDCVINNFQYKCGKDYCIVLENAKEYDGSIPRDEAYTNYLQLQDLVFAGKYCDECPHKSILASIIDPVLHKIF